MWRREYLEAQQRFLVQRLRDGWLPEELALIDRLLTEIAWRIAFVHG
jgi:hypothetical protein